MNQIEINYLFFELIRLSIGIQDSLSRRPSMAEWGELYQIAMKQSLVGVCFAGVQHLCDSDVEDYYGMTELQYLTWMGMAAKIQQRNQTVNSQCVELQAKLSADGLRSCILKGQGIASFYGELSHLRQSGDIDVWADANRKNIIHYVSRFNEVEVFGDLHVKMEVFENTEVEMHFTPSTLSGRKANNKLQDWFNEQKEIQMTNKIGNITIPTAEFNLVYLLLHIYKHYLYEGIGLRQIMDYYFTLCAVQDIQKVQIKLKDFGLEKFAGAVMYMMREVFYLDRQKWLCSVDEKRGKRLQEIVMEGGNFGHSTEKYKITGWNKPWSRLSRYVRRHWFMFRDYPEEILANFTKQLYS